MSVHGTSSGQWEGNGICKEDTLGEDFLKV